MLGVAVCAFIVGVALVACGIIWLQSLRITRLW